ncbi:uncharacterized protein LTR77_001834 [Saxophila tyrrhenica]|uniref:Transcription factor Iwr1 domain-containing protein n=1 Tax=Saxophila tyrrhenica TaxID=1690608 RepID=A0AAV9PLT6_9PEZI|nr:hypothetical protein LTR77_001834 [Saxophila tyrrhenica]
MAEPTRLTIKRRATDDAPDFLLLQGAGAAQNATPVRYVKRAKNTATVDGQQEAQFQQPTPLPTQSEHERRKAKARTFYLSKSPASESKKRKGRDEGVPTFVERKRSKQHAAEDVHNEDEVKVEEPASSPEPVAALPVFKRPGKGSAIRYAEAKANAPVTKPETEAEQRERQALADYIYQVQLQDEEFERQRQPKVQDAVAPQKPIIAQSKSTIAPKLSGAGARAMHQRRVATNGALDRKERSTSPESEDGYIYETYILAPTTDTSTPDIDMTDVSSSENIGYLVVEDSDQPLWQTYLQDEPSSEEDDSDDEDENAEDYYGADYPEDEVESDDEFERNPYRYRKRGGADDEEWDEDTGEYSEDEDVYERMMNPFGGNKVPKGLARYMRGESGSGDEDDSD